MRKLTKPHLVSMSISRSLTIEPSVAFLLVKIMLTQSRLKELLNYDPETGIFTWVANRQKVTIGDVAGTINKGYRAIRIDGKQYKAHRLTFLYMTGNFPKEHTDHIDGDKLNNRWANLRGCTHAENHQNRASHKGSSSKYVGVGWHKASQKWRADIKINGKQKFLGRFETEIAAYASYCKAKSELHAFNPVPR